MGQSIAGQIAQIKKRLAFLELIRRAVAAQQPALSPAKEAE
jgi:hypothetical protein